MSIRHAFGQEDITGTYGSWFSRESKWQKFQKVYRELGFSVRVTGGNFLTHEIDCSNEDFEIILSLMA
jgi:hypothetical protein